MKPRNGVILSHQLFNSHPSALRPAMASLPCGPPAATKGSWTSVFFDAWNVRSALRHPKGAPMAMDSA